MNNSTVVQAFFITHYAEFCSTKFYYKMVHYKSRMNHHLLFNSFSRYAKNKGDD
jgi:hypothetical protein